MGDNKKSIKTEKKVIVKKEIIKRENENLVNVFTFIITVIIITAGMFFSGNAFSIDIKIVKEKNNEILIDLQGQSNTYLENLETAKKLSWTDKNKNFVDHFNNFQKYPLAFKRRGEKTLIEAQAYCSQEAIGENFKNKTREKNFDNYQYDFNNCMSQFIPFLTEDADCDLETVSWGNCSGEVVNGFVGDGETSKLIVNTVAGQEGYFVFRCNNGVVDPVVDVCSGGEQIECEITEEQNIQQPINNLEEASYLRTAEQNKCDFTVSPQTITGGSSVVIENEPFEEIPFDPMFPTPMVNQNTGQLTLSCNDGTLATSTLCEPEFSSCDATSVWLSSWLPYDIGGYVNKYGGRYGYSAYQVNQIFADSVINKASSMSSDLNFEIPNMEHGEVLRVPFGQEENWRGEKITDTDVVVSCKDGITIVEDFRYNVETIDGCTHKQLVDYWGNSDIFPEGVKWEQNDNFTLNSLCGLDDNDTSRCLWIGSAYTKGELMPRKTTRDYSERIPSHFLKLSKDLRYFSDERLALYNDYLTQHKEKISNKTCFHNEISMSEHMPNGFIRAGESIKVSSESQFYEGYKEYTCQSYTDFMGVSSYYWSTTNKTDQCDLKTWKRFSSFGKNTAELNRLTEGRQCLFMGHSACGEKRFYSEGERLYCPEVFLGDRNDYICEQGVFKKIRLCELPIEPLDDSIKHEWEYSWKVGTRYSGNTLTQWNNTIQGTEGNWVSVYDEVDLGSGITTECERRYECVAGDHENRIPLHWNMTVNNCGHLNPQNYCTDTVELYGNTVNVDIEGNNKETFELTVEDQTSNLSQNCEVELSCLFDYQSGSMRLNVTNDTCEGIDFGGRRCYTGLGITCD